MIIRQMTRDDVSACAHILQSVYNNELWQARWTLDTATAYLMDFFEMKKFVGYVVICENKIIGGLFAHEKIWWNNSEVFVEEMFVLPEHQHKGCGSMLIKAVEQYAAGKGLAGITLSTNKYAPAPAFYRKHGFSDCEHVLFMAKEMPQ